MRKKLLTLEDLAQFCETNQFAHFSSEESNYNLYVQVPATFSINESSDKNLEGLTSTTVVACHDSRNLNGSGIATENMETALPSFQLRPILAAIHQNNDGNWDFGSHEMEIIEDPFNEGEERIHYIEHPVGIVYGDCHLEYDEDADVNRVVAQGYLYNDYGNGSVEILNKRGSADCSVELCIREMSYNAKDKYLDLTDFYFNGVTLLGETVSPGMAGSHVTLEDFNLENNSIVAQEGTVVDTGLESKVLETLERIDNTLSSFNKDESSEKGGNDLVKLNELLEKYSVALEDLTFEVEGLSDEELETKFAEVYEDTPEDDESGASEDEADVEEGAEEEEPKVEEENAEEFSANVTIKTYGTDEDGNAVIIYTISHEDIRAALYELLNAQEEADNEWYFIEEVYDEYFIYNGWFENKIYKQEYSVEDDTVAFDGERTEMFKELLTASEKSILEEMRSNYAGLKETVASYENAEKEAKLSEILDSDVYAEIAETEEFKELAEKALEYSIEEVESKADLLLAKHVKETGTFSAKVPEKKKSVKVGFDFTKTDRKQPYGGLFKNK